MPQAVAAVVSWVATTFSISVATATFIVRLAGTVLLSVISSKLFGPRLPEGPGFSGLQVTSTSPLEYRKIIYGTAMVSGPIAYRNLSGTNNSDLWIQVLMCDGLSEDLVSVWIDGEEIPKADIDWTAGTGAGAGSGTGNVTTSAFVGESSATAVKVYYFLGDDDQPVSADLNSAFADIGTNHRCRGITHVIYRLIYSENTAKVWEAGIPQAFRAVIKGRKVYDPRLDSTVVIDDTTSPVTMGSGSHRYTDSSTWEFSDNPALCIADYLTTVMGVDAATTIDWVSVANAADDCDMLVVVPPSASPQNTEKRFTCNGALSLGEDHSDNLDALVSSMAGRLSYSGGKWTVRAGVWEASSVSFTASDLAGDIQVRGSAPKGERFNTVRGYFSDPNRLYEFVEFEPVTNSTYVTRDNSTVIERELELPMTNSEYMAQRIAFRMLEQGNEQKIVNVTLNARGAKAAVGDVVDLTIDELSWSAETFRVINWGRNSDGSFSLTLKEDSSSAYDDPALGEYGTKTAASITVPSTSVPAPSGLTATSVPSGIRLDWTSPPEKLLQQIQVFESTDSSWSNATRIAEVRADTYTSVLDSGTERWYWVRTRRHGGQLSDRDPDSDTSTVTATAGSAAASLVHLNENNYMSATGSVALTQDADAGYVFKTDGRILAYRNGGEYELDVPAFWWQRGQETSVGNNYEVALDSNVSGSWDSGAAVGTYVALTSDRTWYHTRAYTEGTGLDSVTSVFKIRHATATGEAGEKPILGTGTFKATAKIAA